MLFLQTILLKYVYTKVPKFWKINAKLGRNKLTWRILPWDFLKVEQLGFINSAQWCMTYQVEKCYIMLRIVVRVAWIAAIAYMLHELEIANFNLYQLNSANLVEEMYEDDDDEGGG